MDIEMEKRPLWSDENSEEYALAPQSADYLRGVALNLYQDIKCLKEDLAEALAKLAAMGSQKPFGYVNEKDMNQRFLHSGHMQIENNETDYSKVSLYAKPVPADNPAVAVPDGGRVFPRCLSTEARIKWKQRWGKDYSANPDAMWTLFWESVSNDEAPFVAAPSHSHQSAPRITEQDARDIIEEYKHWQMFIAREDTDAGQWCKESSGRELIAKINADRCPSHESEQQCTCNKQFDPWQLMEGARCECCNQQTEGE